MWARLTSLESPVDEADRRLARMLFAVLYGKEIGAGARAEALWAEHALLREEIAGLVPVLRELNAVLTPPHALAPEIPLVLHARYLGVELSAAFDHRTRRRKVSRLLHRRRADTWREIRLAARHARQGGGDEGALALPRLPAQ